MPRQTRHFIKRHPYWRVSRMVDTRPVRRFASHGRRMLASVTKRPKRYIYRRQFIDPALLDQDQINEFILSLLRQL
jgi:hypothetical protein